MTLRLKNLNQQVIVLTGATSGIGLVTARMAAEHGAKLVLAARSADELRRLADEINQAGGEAIDVPTDVSKWEEVERLARTAEERFGRVDTWINDAGISVYGRIDEVPLDDHRQVFETNFWGVVYGCRAAVPLLRRQGGALINLGSIVSDRAVPLQGTYSASKHAVQGFTDALRMELEEEGAPISVTLIKPSAIDTPFTRHAGNYMEVEPKFPPPVYAPETVAEAILHCATHPKRELTVGGGGKSITALGQWMPRLMDKIMEAMMFKQQKSNVPAQHREGSLHQPSRDLAERGGYPGHVSESSVYTTAAMHPVSTLAYIAGAGLVAAGIALATRKSSND